MLFKHYFIFLLLVSVSMLSCKKAGFLSGKDHISYTEFDPTPELTSVDSFTPILPSDREPHPQDSSTYYLLDVNADSNPDFQLTVKHWYAFVSASSPSANYNYEMNISGIGSTPEIATESEGSNHVRIYYENESVDATAKWNNSAVLTRIGGLADTYYPGVDETKYIGLRMKNGSRRNYCWLKINRNKDTEKLTILACGYNTSHGNNILAGQEQ